jgi:transposase
MNRLKAVYRSWAIPCAGRDVYYRRHRAQWLAKIREAGVRRRAERLYEQLDMLQHLRQQARRELLAEGRRHAITAKLRQIPYLGPIRSVLAVALMQTPHRFRTKRQLWAYSGLALETRTSADYRYVEGQLRRSKKLVSIRGLNSLRERRSDYVNTSDCGNSTHITLQASCWDGIFEVLQQPELDLNRSMVIRVEIRTSGNGLDTSSCGKNSFAVV